MTFGIMQHLDIEICASDYLKLQTENAELLKAKDAELVAIRISRDDSELRCKLAVAENAELQESAAGYRADYQKLVDRLAVQRAENAELRRDADLHMKRAGEYAAEAQASKESLAAQGLLLEAAEARVAELERALEEARAWIIDSDDTDMVLLEALLARIDAALAARRQGSDA